MTQASRKPVFRLAIGRRIHVKGCLAILLAPLAVPIIIFIKLAERIFGLKTSVDLTAREVEDYLREFLDGAGGEWDWDDFISVAITDPKLERIREEAAWVELPLDVEGEATLRRLLTEVRTY